jgi:serine/threonine-protein kinase RsbW
MRSLSLQIMSDPANLAPVRHKVEAFCASCGFDDKVIGDIGLCVNEAMANIIRHAYAGATDRPVKVDAEFEKDTLQIRIRDWGDGTDPTHVPVKHDPLTPGGLGMVCLRALMDEMEFERQPDGMLLTIKRRKPTECVAGKK